MADQDVKQSNGETVVFIERRAQGREELTCSQIMELARKRGSKGARRVMDAEWAPAVEAP